MIKFDLHVHTLFSLCGIHTVLELIERAKQLGMSGFAVTDHGPTLGGRLNNPFYERFKSPYPEIKIIKGIECNVLDENGKIDVPEIYRPFIELVLVGLHPNTPKNLGKDVYTSMITNTIKNNPCVDIITHPNDPTYPVDYKELARVAKDYGVAIELNNSKILYARSEVKSAVEIVETCRDIGCLVAVNSDTHAIHELGDDEAVRGILGDANFPENLIVNRDEKSALAFIDGRRANKK